MGNKRTAIYIRLSDEDSNADGIAKAESNSVAAQRLLAWDYIQRNNLSNPADTFEYVDDGFSGTNFQRPAFQRMMDDARHGEIECIIVKDDCVIIELNAESPIKCGFCAVSSIF